MIERTSELGGNIEIKAYDIFEKNAPIAIYIGVMPKIIQVTNGTIGSKNFEISLGETILIILHFSF